MSLRLSRVLEARRQGRNARQSEIPYREGMEAFYAGDRFPRWKGNVFVGGLRTGEIPEGLRRESMLMELRQRIRDVRQGPDGLLYVLTEEEQGALLRIEPVE